jgi:hypothetical protein
MTSFGAGSAPAIMEGRLEKKVVHHTPDGGRLSVWSPRYVVLSHNHLLLKGQLKPGTGGEAVEHVHLLDINVLSGANVHNLLISSTVHWFLV